MSHINRTPRKNSADTGPIIISSSFYLLLPFTHVWTHGGRDRAERREERRDLADGLIWFKS